MKFNLRNLSLSLLSMAVLFSVVTSGSNEKIKQQAADAIENQITEEAVAAELRKMGFDEDFTKPIPQKLIDKHTKSLSLGS